MRTLHRLTATGIARLKDAGYYGDGGGLVLQIAPGGSRSRLFRFTRNGKRREMGLGGLHTISLQQARELAADARRTLLAGDDPIDARDALRRSKLAEAARTVTFRHCAGRCIADRRAEWKNEKHASQWSSTLETYAYPFIGDLDVRAIDTALVRSCIDPIWTSKTETASRVRQRIEAVLDWAGVHGHREGDNPARWRGHLDAVMARPSKVAKVEHHAALRYAQLPALMADLARRGSVSALALRFTILTAARTGEVIGSRWSEINLNAGIWTISAGRMKADVEHVVPLSEAARHVLVIASAHGGGDLSNFVFPGARKGRPMSDMTMLELVRGIALKDAAGEPATGTGCARHFDSGPPSARRILARWQSTPSPTVCPTRWRVPISAVRSGSPTRAGKLVAAFDEARKKGDSVAEAIGKLGKAIDATSIDGITAAGAALDKLGQTGKASAATIQDAWIAALRSIDLGVFATEARSAF